MPAMEYEVVLFDLYGTLVDGRARAIDGARALLETLPPNRWAIVTSCYNRLAVQMLTEARLPIPEVLITSDLVLANKPSPQGYLLAASRLATRPADCLVVEDSLPGVCAALAAGMDVVAISAQSDCELTRRATTSIKRIADLRIVAMPDGRFRAEG